MAKPQFVFRKHTTIGAMDAIDDKTYLNACFIDQGELSVLQDTTDPRCIVLGRTGSGKTALIEQMADEERHIKINPDQLSLAYVSNSQVIQFFVQRGVNMDLFYRLLWRHIFTVEILKHHYKITSESRLASFVETIKMLIGNNKNRRAAIDYMLECGGSFWRETEYRVKEITRKIEDDLQKSVGLTFSGSLPGIAQAQANVGLSNNQSLSEETLTEVIHNRGQQVVNDTQIATLSDVMKFLHEEILNDKKQKYYITIDTLDEKWVDDNIRFHLIRALLATIKDINHTITHVKIIVAIREDLLARVFRVTRDSGHQEEKYRSLCLNLKWSSSELEDLLDLRINHLIRPAYTTDLVRLRDILPNKIANAKHVTPVQYIIERTMMRPRDAISFVNECIVSASGSTLVTNAHIQEAEITYSKNRLRALADEWFADYPSLIELIICLLQDGPRKFTFSHFTMDSMIKFLSNFRNKRGIDFEKYRKECPVVEAIVNYDTELELDLFLQTTFRILAKVGAVGVKPFPSSATLWGYNTDLDNAINSDSVYYVHPAFYKVLNIKVQA